MILSAVGDSFESLLTRRGKTFCFTKLPSTKSPQLHQCLNGFFLTVFIVAVSFLRIPFTVIWVCMEAGRRNKPSLGIRALSIGPPAKGNKSNAKKSRFRAYRNSTGTIYHWSVILRVFSVIERDGNGFFKVLLLSSHLLISRHPVRKSKFGASAVKGYCSYNLACAYNFLNYWQPTESPARRSFVLCWIGKCDILYRVFQKFVPIFYSYKFP